MSEFQAMRAIATNPKLAPYISPKRLERVAKCCEHYQELGYSSTLQTSNILKRIYLTETAFTDKFLSRQKGHTSEEHQYQEMLKIATPFGEYLTKAQNIINDTIKANGGIK